MCRIPCSLMPAQKVKYSRNHTSKWRKIPGSSIIILLFQESIKTMMGKFLLFCLYLVLYIHTQIELTCADCTLNLPDVDNIQTGFRLEPHIKIRNRDICSIFFVKKVHECLVLCSTQRDCGSFTYDKIRHVCSLHNGTSKNFPEDTSIQVMSSTTFYYESLSTRLVSFS